MTKLNEKIEQDAEENKDVATPRESNWFKFLEGDNQFRILIEPEVLYEKYKVGICYTDCGYTGTPKYLTWILDKADNKVKLFKLPFTIFQQIAGYQEDADYAFTEFPMPYDLKITATGAGTKEVGYVMLPKPVKELTDEEKGIVAEKMAEEQTKTPAEIIARMKEKQIEKHKLEGKPEITDEKKDDKPEKKS